jgi:catechol 2,3-dioxygenase-like lactoylglutathione lyase family enzyme
MSRIQVQGVHHITLVGSNRQSAIDFWQGLLGMRSSSSSRISARPTRTISTFDPGDGRLITVFTNETRKDDPSPHPRDIGHLEHIAFNVSRATQTQVAKRLEERGIPFKAFDRGFMDSIYFSDPNGLRLELACYKFQTPEGFRDADVLIRADALRRKAGDHHITEKHLADAIEELMAVDRRFRLSRAGCTLACALQGCDGCEPGFFRAFDRGNELALRRVRRGPRAGVAPSPAQHPRFPYPTPSSSAYAIP